MKIVNDQNHLVQEGGILFLPLSETFDIDN